MFEVLVNPCGRCECCEKFKLVRLDVDPYQAELYNDETLCWLCEDCAEQLWLDT